MYEEKRPNFVFKDIILKIIFIVLLIIVIVGLFPTKKYVESLIDQKMGTNENQIFNSNVQSMKEAALSYYNGDRLPEKSDKLTLKQMQEKDLIIDVTDSDGKSCDTKKSYVKVTANEKDYKLEINLVCGKKDEKVISYFGSYDYCANGVCEKKKLTESDDVALATEASDSDECQYSKTTSGYTNYSNWSSWSTSKVSGSSTRQVETKVEKVKTGTITEQSGTKKITQNPKKVTATKDGLKFVVYVCPADFDNGGSYTMPKLCEKTVSNYVTKDTYKNVTYYRYRDRSYLDDKVVYKWSACNDTSLINQGFKETGNVR